jgi:hypothetical protein
MFLKLGIAAALLSASALLTFPSLATVPLDQLALLATGMIALVLLRARGP